MFSGDFDPGEKVREGVWFSFICTFGDSEKPGTHAVCQTRSPTPKCKRMWRKRKPNVLVFNDIDPSPYCPGHFWPEAGKLTTGAGIWVIWSSGHHSLVETWPWNIQSDWGLQWRQGKFWMAIDYCSINGPLISIGTALVFVMAYICSRCDEIVPRDAMISWFLRP